MPKYEIELSDGKKFIVEADKQPSEEDVYNYISQQEQPQEVMQQPEQQETILSKISPDLDRISKLMGQGVTKGVAGAGDIISAGLTTAYNQLPFIQKQDINYGQLGKSIDTTNYIQPENLLETGAELAGGMLSGGALAPTGINIVNQGLDKVLSGIGQVVSPVTKKAINSLVGKVGKDSSEKMVNYIIQNPEVALKPAVKKTELFPSTFQQSYKEGFNAFKGIKKEIGTDIGNIKEYAKANSGTLKTDISDVYKSVSDELNKGIYDKNGKVYKLLKDIKDTIGENIIDTRKVTKPNGVYTEQVMKEIDFNKLDDLFTKLTNSDSWSNSILTKGFDLSSGQRFGLEAVNNLKTRLYDLYDKIPDLSADFAQKRGAYKAIKDLEFKARINEPEDIAEAFMKATRTGNEDLLDGLQQILPKDVFDKNIATILNMSKKKWSEFLTSRGYSTGMGTIFLTAPVEALEAGAGRLIAAGKANPTNYALTGGANFEKALAGGTQKTLKTIGDLLKVAPRFIGQ